MNIAFHGVNSARWVVPIVSGLRFPATGVWLDAQLKIEAWLLFGLHDLRPKFSAGNQWLDVSGRSLVADFVLLVRELVTGIPCRVTETFERDHGTAVSGIPIA